MANEGGGKIKNKRGNEAPKPYSRNPSFLGRVKDSVKEIFSPSLFLDLISSTKKKTPPNTPTPEQELDDDVEEQQNHVKFSSNMPMQMQQQQASPQANQFGGGQGSSLQAHLARATSQHSMQQSAEQPSTSFTPDHRLYSQFNKLPPPNVSHSPPVMNGENLANANEYSLSGAGKTSLQLTDKNIAQLRKDLHNPMSPGRELDEEPGGQMKSSTANASSFLWSNEVKQKPASRPQSAAKTNKPSFNTSAFRSSMLQSADRSSFIGGSSSLHESSYYGGKTTFGGASSRCNRSRGSSPYQSTSATRKQLKPRVIQGSSSAVTSSSAKKILETLENMSTPLNDAKKMPSYASRVESPLTFTPYSYRRRSIPNRSLGASVGGPPVKSLQTPTAATIRENLYRPPLHTLPSPSLPPKSSAPQASLAAQNQSSYKVGESSSSAAASRGAAGGGHGGKMKQDRGGGIHYKRGLEEDDEDFEVPDLPTGFTLPVTNFTSFNLPVSPVQGKPISHDVSSPLASDSGFKFSSPILKPMPDNITTSNSPPAEFTFSSPISLNVNQAVAATSSSSTLRTGSSSATSITSGGSSSTTSRFGSNSTSSSSSTGVNFTSPASTTTSGAGAFNSIGMKFAASTAPLKLKAKDPAPIASTASSPAASELKMTGSVLDSLSNLSKKPDNSPSTSFNNNSNGSSELKPGSCLDALGGFGGKVNSEEKNGRKSPPPLSAMFKSAPGTWECSMCMCTNKPDVTVCPACETPKPGPPAAPIPSSMIKTATEPGFKPLSELFKKSAGQWTCDVCMIDNKPDATKCAACETPAPHGTATGPSQAPEGGSVFGKPPAPSSTTSSSGPSLAQMFKKPSGSWECDTCMVQNKSCVDVCIACETPKPGATPKPTSNFKSAGGFQFGAGGGLKFGSIANNNNTDSSKPAVNGGDGFQAAGFKFGGSSTDSSKNTSSATFGGSSIKFGSATSGESKKDTSSVPPAIASFGKPLSTETPPPAFGSIKFGDSGNKKAEEKTNDTANKDIASDKPATSGFSFGSKPAGSSLSTPDFSNKTPSTTKENTSSASKPPPAYPGGFNFGAPPAAAAANKTPDTTKTTTPSASSNLFQFGQTSAASTQETKCFGTPVANSTPLSSSGKTPGENTPGNSKPMPTFGSPAFNAFGSSKAEEKKDTPVATGTFGTSGFAFSASKTEEKKEASAAVGTFGTPGFAFGSSKPEVKKDTPASSGTFGTAGFSFGASSSKTDNSAAPGATPNLFGAGSTDANKSSAAAPSFNISAGSFGAGQKRAIDQTFAGAAATGNKRTREAPSTPATPYNFKAGTAPAVFATPQAGTPFAAPPVSAAFGGAAAGAPAFGSAPAAPGVFQFGQNSAPGNVANNGSSGSNSENKAFSFSGGASLPTAPPAVAPASQFNFSDSTKATNFNFAASTTTTSSSSNAASSNNQAPFQFGAAANPAAAASNNPFSVSANNAPRRQIKKAVRRTLPKR